MTRFQRFLAAPQAPSLPRRVGRPRRGESASQRRVHVDVLVDVTVRGLTLAQVAKRRGLSVSTVARYRDAALTYRDDPRVQFCSGRAAGFAYDRSTQRLKNTDYAARRQRPVF